MSCTFRADIDGNKDADRRVAGKFITVYPASPDDLHSHLTELDAALKGLPGPYVLTDLRWNEGPVYVRYGAFTRQYVTENGTDVPAIRDLDTGALVPDVRTTAFHVPPWVQIPDFLQAQLDRLEAAPPEVFPEVRGALQFSNAGGVYDARFNGEALILKEGRPHVGWTPDGRDAVQRLKDETRILRTLHGRVPLPAVVATFRAHDHEYLAMERIDALSLNAAVVARNPLSRCQQGVDARRAYRDWAAAVTASLRAAVAALHDAGHAHGDLHPGNVLVREDDTVVLIDLEMARATDDSGPAIIGAPGFVSPKSKSARDQDLYALACIELFMFLPLTTLLPLDAEMAEKLLREAAAQFELGRSWVDDHRAALSPRRADQVPRGTAPSAPATTTAIIRTLRSDATPERDDRLWPGDPAQFNEPPSSLAHGALGVLSVLHRAGVAATAQHLRWVELAESRYTARRRLGLLDGTAGAVWAYRRLGLHDAADRRLAQLSERFHDLGYDLYGGLPGVGLTLLAESGHHPRLLDTAVGIARSIRERWHAATPPSKVDTGGGGLLNGATGSALFALRLYETTGDERHLQIASSAVDHDLHSLRAAPDGSLQVDEGWRLLPYLGNGSAGIGVLLAQLLRHLPGHGRYLETLDGIARAATAPFTIHCGLFQGRAGLIQFLLTLERVGLATGATSGALRHHVSALELHTVRRDDGVRFAGDGLLRASCDLATGAAGVLATLIDYEAHLRGQTPDSACFPYLTPPDGVEIGSPLSAAELSGGR